MQGYGEGEKEKKKWGVVGVVCDCVRTFSGCGLRLLFFKREGVCFLSLSSHTNGGDKRKENFEKGGGRARIFVYRCVV